MVGDERRRGDSQDRVSGAGRRAAGTLYFTVADGNTTNIAEIRQIIERMLPSRSAQLISNVNSLRANTKAYVRVWRADPAYQMEGRIFRIRHPRWP